MSWTPERGVCYLRPSGPRDENHLFVILHGPEQWPSYVSRSSPARFGGLLLRDTSNAIRQIW